MSIKHIRTKFYDNLHDALLCTIPTLLPKSHLEKGAGHIIEYLPPLVTPTSTDLKKDQEKWLKFMDAHLKGTKEACDYFLSK